MRYTVGSLRGHWSAGITSKQNLIWHQKSKLPVSTHYVVGVGFASAAGAVALSMEASVVSAVVAWSEKTSRT